MIEISTEPEISEDTWHPSDDEIQRWIETVLTNYPKKQDAILSVCIVTAQTIQDLNLKYRNKNKPTNVLSFPSKLPPAIQIRHLGDMILCAQIINQEALEQSKASADHWAHMVVHGTLHLLGYDHQREEEAQLMESLEVKLLKTLGVQNPYT